MAMEPIITRSGISSSAEVHSDVICSPNAFGVPSAKKMTDFCELTGWCAVTKPASGVTRRASIARNVPFCTAIHSAKAYMSRPGELAGARTRQPRIGPDSSSGSA